MQAHRVEVDVADHRRTLEAQEHPGQSEAGPTVVLLTVSGAAGEHWAEFLPLMADSATCITYGRPGLGGSDPLPEAARAPGGLAGAVEELHQLLHAISEPPWVLVTASVGAFIADRYTTTHPEDVAAVVFTDPTSSSPWPAELVRLPHIEDADTGWTWSWEACYAELAIPPHAIPPAVVVSSSEGRWVRQPPARTWWLPLTLEQVDTLWQEFQAQWATRWNAPRVIAETAGHFVHKDQPDLVAAVVQEVLAAVHTGRDLRISAEQAGAMGSRLAP